MPDAGRDVFFGARAACSACHTVNGEGGRIGPDLSKIGAIRTGRDLLEAIVFPSASFVRGYEPYLVADRDGRQYTGTLARETVEAIFLHTTEGAEVRIPRASLEELQQGRVSIMPQGLDDPAAPRAARRPAGVPAVAPLTRRDEAGGPPSA